VEKQNNNAVIGGASGTVRELYMSHRLETLADELAEVLARPMNSPLQPEVIIVQSQGMARWLKLELARRHGVCANYIFPFPKLFCTQTLAAGSTDSDSDLPFDRDTVLWSIMRLLPDMLTQPEFNSLRNYLFDQMDVRKRFQLSAQIANLFDQYLVFRPELILAWDQGKLIFADSEKKQHEIWQAALWRRLRQDTPSQHLAGLWDNFIARAAQPGFKPVGGLPERISIFGISSLPPIYLHFIYALGNHVGVHMFLLQPSKEYWGSIVSVRESERILKALKKGDAAGDDLHLDTGNRLLASMGQLGRDFLNLVLEVGDWEDHSLFPDSDEDTLLHHVQADIFHLRDRGRNDSDKVSITSTDGSLRLHSCHSPLREVEVLYDHLLDWFEKDPHLAPREILVMTPDIDTYAPFIQAVFDSPEEERKRIPFSLADRGARSTSQTVDAYLNLLNLPSTRLEVASLIHILEVKAVRDKFSLAESDLDPIRFWVRNTNIRWGKDAEYREGLGLPRFAENSWQQGMDRLFLGYAMAGGGEKMFNDILPFDDVEGSSAEVLGHFAEYLTRVFDMVSILEQPRRVDEWEAVLTKILDDFFQPDETQAMDALLLRSTLRELTRQAVSAGSEDVVNWGVVLEALNQSLREDRFGSGFISGGMTFCALKPMRSIPFKVICLIGMNDGAFPRSDRHLSFDLIAQKPRLGDRSLRADDRYLFLETLLSARQRLHISYIGQSIRDNSKAPPSVLVSELLDYIAQAFDLSGNDILKDLVVVQHRLQAFSPTYFKSEDPRLFSYSAENCHASHCGQQPRVTPSPFIDKPLAEPEADWRTVDITTLAQFFCHPAKWLLTRRLGLRFDEGDEALEEVEPFIVGSLDGYAMRQELVEMNLKGVGFKDALTLMKASGRLPLGEAGAIYFRQLQTEVQAFLDLLRPHLGEGYNEPIQVNHSIGKFRVYGEIRHLTPTGLLHFRCANIKAKDRLRLWIQQVLLNVAFPDGKHASAVLVGRDEVLKFPLIAGAPAILTDLLELYWQGLTQPLKFFPQTSLAYAESSRNQTSEKSRDSISAALTTWEGNSFTKVPGEGADAYFDLCFRSTNPLDQEFEQIARKVFDPQLEALKGANV
jgi:exodeoxyribonuclease V gamma subunit